MDSLLCDEDWLNSPSTYNHHHQPKIESSMDYSFCTTTEEDCKNAFMICLHKESSYMPKVGYVERLHQSSNLLHARIKAIQFFVKCCSRLNLASQTVFDAVNYFDCFISMKQSNYVEGDEGLAELLSVVCLSISAKFGEVSIPQWHELQMDDHLNHSFQPSTIQLMELEVLKALQWRLNCVTSYSYMELLLKFLDNDLQPNDQFTLSLRVTELLLGALSDAKFLEFRPCAVAVSAIRCSLEELLPSKSEAYLFNLVSFIPQDQKVDMETCHKIMEERLADPIHSLTACGFQYLPSSPVTVMPMQRIHALNCYIDLSMVSRSNVVLPLNPNKRKRERDSLFELIRNDSHKLAN
ncbi:Cyclin-d4-2 [Thalictrum thalictroides]|uniref:Cyclin-d4-2 n=1 Tax=Thalictrum thalictroides TaxID=46969 RepID=A0A7J6UUK9_THATH|nr:Cyclin-d4-2 [Thalictrum thalictroides]